MSPQATATACAVEELIPPAHTADATGVTVEVPFSWHIIVGYAAKRAEVGCKLDSTVQASATLGQLLQLGTVVAQDRFQQLAWQGVILSLHEHIVSYEHQERVLRTQSSFCTDIIGYPCWP
jgi:hypothetical protein